MIAKLKRKIFFSMEITALSVLLAVLVVINVSNGVTYARNQKEFLRLALETVNALDRETRKNTEDGDSAPSAEFPEDGTFPAGENSFRPAPGSPMGPPLDDTLMVRDANLHGRRALSLMMSSDMAAVSVGQDGKAIHALGFAEGMDPSALDTLCQSILSLDRTEGTVSGYQFAVSSSGSRRCIALIRSMFFRRGSCP